jgi:hypothetical protein
MPTEQILPLALSGAEIKKAILDKIALALNRDCHLNDNLAYGDGFSFKVQIEIKAEDLGRKIEGTTSVEGAMHAQIVGDEQILVPGDPREYESLEAAEAHIEMTSTDPTATRIETGQDVPTRVTDKQGHDKVESVRYRRDASSKGK